ncbi:hypothetical protein LO772_05015 [Yinghuangia sp. ASG 101]|uniref:hypothetical protein n=1 Tax=Yinghuangia sp. ASG 101 TaxID=2896848 RepID=UPI001E3B546F|nr:hypothetical protein [Yinghuangia sp. ASG 101]UGQ12986.1 hypothetical protein LO772_05015 [Yinghuangia sp. ASG 101]
MIRDALRHYARRDVIADERGWWLVPEGALDVREVRPGHRVVSERTAGSVAGD